MADAAAPGSELLPPRFRDWFASRGWAPRPHQLAMVEKSRAGRDALLIAVIGLAAIGFALALPSVLDSIVAAYSFMVAGLFVPTLAALLWPRATSGAAFWSMVVGGGSALAGTLVPALFGPVEPIVVGLGLSAVVLVAATLASPPAAASVTLPERQEAS